MKCNDFISPKKLAKNDFSERKKMKQINSMKCRARQNQNKIKNVSMKKRDKKMLFLNLIFEFATETHPIERESREL